MAMANENVIKNQESKPRRFRVEGRLVTLEKLGESLKGRSVTVRRNCQNWQTGIVLFDDLRDFHFRAFSGGIAAPCPHGGHVYARMWCNSLIDGEVAHSCAHGEGPHEILVCLLKADNDRDVMKYVEAVA